MVFGYNQMITNLSQSLDWWKAGFYFKLCGY